MARPKSPDPAERLVISLPRSIKRLSRATANARKLTLSAWVLELIREHFRAMERALRHDEQ